MFRWANAPLIKLREAAFAQHMHAVDARTVRTNNIILTIKETFLVHARLARLSSGQALAVSRSLAVTVCGHRAIPPIFVGVVAAQ